MNSFWNRNYSDDFYNDLSTTIFCSFRFYSWNSTDFVSFNWIYLCFIAVSIKNVAYVVRGRGHGFSFRFHIYSYYFA